jgi:hypothetical protein
MFLSFSPRFCSPSITTHPDYMDFLHSYGSITSNTPSRTQTIPREEEPESIHIYVIIIC